MNTSTYRAVYRITTKRIFVLRSFERDDPEIGPASAPVLENPEQQTKWYFKHFLGKFHRNYAGINADGHHYVLSVLEESSFGKTQHRAILWTKDGPKRLCLRLDAKSVSTKQILAHFGVERPPKEVN